jgi:hypothetical protein
MFWGLGLVLSCWCVCYSVGVAWTKTLSALRRRRVEAAVRTELARGLADIELFLKACSAPARTQQPPDADDGEPSQA